MARHKHADLIHAWAEGAEIQLQHNDGTWHDCDPAFIEEHNYRIKPKESEWYENIPEYGVLCWVSDSNSEPNSSNYLKIIIRKPNENPSYPFVRDKHNVRWQFATPLTNEEISQFLR